MIKSLLPQSFQSDLTLEFENIINTLNSLPIKEIANFWNVDKCRVDLLPFLAKNLGIESFDVTWSESYKRKVIKQSLFVAKKKGTVASVKRTLEALNLNTAIKEWFDFGYERGTARIEMISDTSNTQERLALINQEINRTKRLACTVVQTFRNAETTFIKIGVVLKTTKKYTIKGA